MDVPISLPVFGVLLVLGTVSVWATLMGQVYTLGLLVIGLYWAPDRTLRAKPDPRELPLMGWAICFNTRRYWDPPWFVT